MKITLSVADPAGNITILVRTPVPRRDYAEIANRLLAIESLHAEQVGYIVPPRLGGDVRLEMMGGEFCGNALRSTALWYAHDKGISGPTTVMTEISGSAAPLPVLCDTSKNSVTAQMPLPESICRREICGVTACAVCFEGIVHLVVTEPAAELSDDEVRAALRDNAGYFDKEAAGLLRYSPDTGDMRPAVYVAPTDTLVYERSCASGSAAVAAFAASGKADGAYSLSLRQPGGVLTAEAEVCGGKLARLLLGGTIALTDEQTIEI